MSLWEGREESLMANKWLCHFWFGMQKNILIYIYISNKLQCYTVYFIWKLLCMFRVVPPPIIRSANNCTCSIWYLSHHYCHLPLSWKSWNWFECAVGGVRHPQRTQILHLVGYILEYYRSMNVKCRKILCALSDVAHSVRDFPHGKAPVVRADPSSLLWLGAKIKECIKLHIQLPMHPCEMVLKHRDCTCVYLCMHVCIMLCTTCVKFVWTCCFTSHVTGKCGGLWTRK
jgi:hypothetical protein